MIWCGQSRLIVSAIFGIFCCIQEDFSDSQERYRHPWLCRLGRNMRRNNNNHITHREKSYPSFCPWGSVSDLSRSFSFLPMKAKKKKKKRERRPTKFSTFNNLRDVILEKKNKIKIVADELCPESIRNKKQQVDINLRKSNNFIKVNQSERIILQSVNRIVMSF